MMVLKSCFPFNRNYFRFRVQLKRVSFLLSILLYASILYFLVKITRKGQGQLTTSENFYAQTIKNTNSDIQNETQINKVIAVLVLVCNRVTVTRTLDAIFKHRPSTESFPVILSHDCGDEGKGVNSLVRQKYGEKITYLVNPNYEDTHAQLNSVASHMKGYYHIASHYGWALNYIFNTFGYDNVIIVEDDLDISPDFFEYFQATLPLLYKDNSIWCVSAYNDNGKPQLIDEKTPELLYRTDFFPGLGWMLTRNLWQELSGKWPNKFWDDWMRHPDQRKERVCIHPEISRSKTFGKIGVSNGQFFDLHLRSIKLYDQFVPFQSNDLSYLQKNSYDEYFFNKINSTTLVSTLRDLEQKINSSGNRLEGYRLIYRSEIDFKKLARTFGLMEDFKWGVPRSGYKGVVRSMYKSRRLYLVPISQNKSEEDFSGQRNINSFY